MAYPRSDHYDGKQFFNPGGSPAKGLLDVLRWKMTSRATPWTRRLQHSPSPDPPPAFVGHSRCRITFVNHATVLIQCDGINILTDPIWSERASPFTGFGPRRLAPPGINFESLPRINLVLLSHNHYDHLDLPTLKRLAERDKPKFLVPLGLAELLSRNGLKAEREMDWWDVTGEITCVPAYHFSARGITDRNRSLWCGYWIAAKAGAVYFAADTAFGPHFEQIRQRLGSPRLALLPIGAYKPEWFMGPVHMSPTQAVEAHRTLAPGRSVAIHWGTFQLADDEPGEALNDLNKALRRNPLSAPFDAIENGTFLEF